MGHRALIYFGLCVMIARCSEPYNPKLSSSSVNVLVVEGTVNTTDSTAQVKLSRAVSLKSAVEWLAETGAKVTIEELGGSTVTLVEGTQGFYSANFVSSVQKQYRLSISTASGKKYVSDNVTAHQSPPIDSLFWKPGDDGISVVVNTHDPANQTHYYHWTFDETWEYITPYTPILVKKNGQVVAYSPPLNLHTCWTTISSQPILTYSTTAFSEDRVSEFRIQFLSAGSQQLGRRYSVEVKQQAISEDEYNFWQELRATSQNLGGLFDPLPTQVIGNIHGESDANELVLGYFNAGTYARKRIFIDQNDLPKSLQKNSDYSYCSVDSIPIRLIGQYADGTLFVSFWGSPFPLGYISGTTDCIDCRTRGGSIIKPSFWK